MILKTGSFFISSIYLYRSLSAAKASDFAFASSSSLLNPVHYSDVAFNGSEAVLVSYLQWQIIQSLRMYGGSSPSGVSASS